MLAPDRDGDDPAAALLSKSKNTPFDGWTLSGGVAATIVGGRIGLQESGMLRPDHHGRTR